MNLSNYHAFSYVDCPLADADIRAFSTRTSGPAESNRAMPIFIHKYQFYHIKLSPDGPSPEWGQSFSAPLPTVMPLLPLKEACVVILRLMSVLGEDQNIDTMIYIAIFRLEVHYRNTGAKYRYLIIFKLWSVCVCVCVCVKKSHCAVYNWHWLTMFCNFC